MAEAGLGIALALLAAWILLPLFSKRLELHAGDYERAGLIEARDAAFRSILDLELDQKLGKVSVGDYDQMRREEESEAIKALRQLDSFTPEQDQEDLLEAEIAKARKRLRP